MEGLSRLVSSNQQESNMQRSVSNRAAIEAADTKEVGGRVTADEVNLDRFHNHIRKVCAFVAATLIPSSLRWILLFFVLIVPQVLWGAQTRLPRQDRRGTLPWGLRPPTRDVRLWRFFLMKSGFTRATELLGDSRRTMSIP